MEEKGQIDCTSCGILLVAPSGRGVRPWGHSHNLPVKHFKHLESDPKNFSPRCQNWMGHKGCHEKLDNFEFDAIKNFIDIDSIMQYRKERNKEAYNKFVTGLRNVGCDKFDYIE